jgi:hypothetical protein
MKIFVSSVTHGFEAFRHAASRAVVTLGHQAIRAEDFGAAPGSPQQACLAGVRDADTMILILGSRYGHVQASGLSPTHEEYREARDTRPVLVFIQQAVNPERQQAEFIREVRGWEQGHFTAEFEDAEGLRDKVIRALHDYVLANEAGPIDEAELASSARTLASSERSTGRPDLIVTIASGPLRTVLRPAELESENLRRCQLAEALTGADALLTPSLGTDTSISGDALRLMQNQGSGLVALDESANLLVVQPTLENNNWRSGIPSLIEEAVTERITTPSDSARGFLTTSTQLSGSATLRRSPHSAVRDIFHGAPGWSTSTVRIRPRWASAAPSMSSSHCRRPSVDAPRCSMTLSGWQKTSPCDFVVR